MYDPLKNDKFIKQIIDAVSNNRLIIFAGAGISKLCGLPLWGELAHNLLLKCVQSKNSSFEYKDLELLENRETDSRKKITIAKNIMVKQSNGDPTNFIKELENQLKVDLKLLDETSKNNYEMLPKILFDLTNTIITTNADKVLDKELNGDSGIIYKSDDFNSTKIGNGKNIFHIHGSINDFGTMVFSADQYLSRYSSGKYKSFLKRVFSNNNYTILIVGYSLSELELLDFFVNSNKKEIHKSVGKTFLLEGYYSYESSLVDENIDYYKILGIDLVPYSKDKNGFQELVNVLDKIKKKVCEESEKTINDLSELFATINSRPSKLRFDKFKNRYLDLDDNKRIYLFEQIEKSKYKVEWANKIRKDTFFASKSDDQAYLSDSKNVPNPLHIFFLSLETTNAGLNTYIRRLTILIIENLQKKFDSKTNTVIPRFVSKKISNDPSILSTDVCLRLLNDAVTKDAEGFWCFFLCYKNNVLTKLRKKYALLYLQLLLRYFYESNNKHYYLESFLDSYSFFYLEHYPNKLFDYCIELLADRLNTDKYLAFSMDCFTDIEKKDYHYDTFYDILKLLLASINYIDDVTICRLYIKYSKMGVRVFKNLSIYILNKRFEILRNHLKENLDVHSRYQYAEIYCLVENNCGFFSKTEYKQIIDYINLLIFDNKTDVWNKYAKYHLLMLLQKSELFASDIESKSLYDSLSYLINEEEKEVYSGMPVPHELSKSIWSTIYEGKTKIKNNDFEKMTATDFLKFYKDYNEFDKQSIGHEVIKHKLKNSDFLNEIKKLKKELPYDLLQSIVSVLMSDNYFDNPFKELKEFVNPSIENYLKIKKYSYQHLYFYILNNIKYINEHQELKEEMYAYLFSDVYLTEDDLDEIDQYHRFYFSDNKVFFWMSAILRLCQPDKWPALKEYLNTIIFNDNYFSSVIKASIVASSSFVWLLDSSFFKTNLTHIFNNNCKGTNISFVAFDYSLFYNSEFITELFNKNILIDLLNCESFELSWNYVYLIIYLFIGKKLGTEILEPVMKTKDAGHGFNYYIDWIRDSSYIEKNVDCINCLFGVVADGVFEDGDHYAIKMLEKSKLLCRVPNYIRCIKQLFSVSNDSVNAKKLKVTLIRSEISKEDVEEIVYCYFKRLNEAYLFKDDVGELFKSVEWSSREKRSKALKELIDKNPDFIKLK